MDEEVGKRLTKREIAADNVCDRISDRSSSRILRAAVMLTLAAAMNTALAGGGNFARRSTDPTAQAAKSAQQQAVGAAEAVQSTMRSMESFRRLSDTRQKLLDLQAAARSAAQSVPSTVPNGLQSGGLQAADTALANASDTLDINKLWSGAKAPTQTQANGRTQIEIVQTDSKAILTWKSFNVGRETDVHFNQAAGGDQSKEWIALNRVTEPTLKPSTILGSITAEGQVYLINPNGILFGATSQVNVHSLIASSLDLRGDTIPERNDLFQRGILADLNASRLTPVFGESLLGPAKSNESDSYSLSDGVIVDKGARITADSLGNVWLFGHSVSNDGSIEAADGQVILAAGKSIFLLASTQSLNPDLRGAYVGVDFGGLARNQGIITDHRGNITLAGKSVINSGLIESTTSARSNGSIRLLAGDFINTGGDDIYDDNNDAFYDPWRDFTIPVASLSLPTEVHGQVSLGAASVTAIVPELAPDTAVGASQFRPSRLEIVGLNITLEQDASILAPAATVLLRAMPGGLRQILKFDFDAETFSYTTLQFKAPDSRIYLAPGASIDVAGLSEVQLPMEANVISPDWRLNELRDAPLQRSGFLHGQHVPVDIRFGTSLADLSSYYALREYSTAELMTKGGDLTLDATQIIARPSSRIDLSGGSVRYLDGYVPETRIVAADGSIHSIVDADPNLTYVDYAGRTYFDHSRWGVSDMFSSPLLAGGMRFEQGYVEGRDAGTLHLGELQYEDVDVLRTALNAQALVIAQSDYYNCTAACRTPIALGTRVLRLEGDLTANVTIGPHQTRHDDDSEITPQNAWLQIPRAATLSMGLTLAEQFQLHPTYADNGDRIEVPFASTLPIEIAARSDELPPTFSSTSRLSEEKALLISPKWFANGTFGNVTLSAFDRGVTVARDTTLDAGLFGQLDIFGALQVDGAIRAVNGRVEVREWSAFDGLVPGKLILGDNAKLDLSGQWINQPLSGISALPTALAGGSLTAGVVTFGKNSLVDVSGGGLLSIDEKLTPGDAGSIDVQNSMVPSGAVRGYSLANGGSLTLHGGSFVIGDTSAGMPADFFGRDGFIRYSLQGSTTIVPGAVLAPVAQSLLWDRSRAPATGFSLFGALDVGILPDGKRPPLAIDLGVVPADPQAPLTSVAIGTKAQVRLDPGSSLTITATDNVFVDGAIDVPGGFIAIDVSGDYSLYKTTGPTIRLGPNAQLLAKGYAFTAADGRGFGVRPGGSITLDARSFGGPANANNGSVLVDRNATLDVSGISGEVAAVSNEPRKLNDASTSLFSVSTGSAGGFINITTVDGFIAGALRASPGVDAAQGGVISIATAASGVQQVSNLALVAGDSRLFSVAKNTTGTGSDLLVATDRLLDSAADTLSLTSANAISVSGPMTLSARRALILDTSMIGLQASAPNAMAVEFIAPYMALGSASANSQNSIGTKFDHSSITFRADLLDLRTLSFGLRPALFEQARGFDDARFVVGGDLRFIGGRLDSAGRLYFESAQAYMVTPASPNGGYTINAFDNVTFKTNGTYVTRDGALFDRSGNPAPIPLAAGGTLNVSAPLIEQGGVLRAPLGTINLRSTSGAVNLLPGSFTSVSLGGQIVPAAPFQDPLSATDQRSIDELSARYLKTITLTAPNVQVESGAVVDISGGGDLYGYVFQPGNGGSRDILSQPDVFAILPNYRLGAAPSFNGAIATPVPAFAPTSSSALTSTSLQAGDSIYLKGGGGISEGSYLLLPAHFALLPGGMAVTIERNDLANLPSTAQLLNDGSVVMGAYRGVAGLPIRDPLYSLARIMPAAAIRERSTYRDALAGSYLPTYAKSLDGAAGTVPQDGGALVLAATSQLAVLGQINGTTEPAARPASLDITAQRIAILGEGFKAPDASYLTLSAEQLSAQHFGTLTIGAQRIPFGADTQLNVSASDVLVLNDANSPLRVQDIILAGTNKVTLTPGSVIVADGPEISGKQTEIDISGDSAALLVSSRSSQDLVRGSAFQRTGSLELGERARLESTGALALNASTTIQTNDSTILKAKELSLSSAVINLGDVPDDVIGTKIGPATLAALSEARRLTLTSGSLEFYGNVTLGNRDADGRPLIDSIVIAGALTGRGVTGNEVKIAAKEIELNNHNVYGTTGVFSPKDTGSLLLESDRLSMGGSFEARRFSSVTISAREFNADDAADPFTSLGMDAGQQRAPLNINTDRLTVGNGVSFDITSDGPITIRPFASAATSVASQGEVGGILTIKADSLLIDSTIDVPAGSLQATTVNDLSIGDHAHIVASGASKSFFDVVRSVDGGTVALQAGGNIHMQSAAIVDVSAAQAGGNAGRIDIVANKIADLSGHFMGSALHGLSGAVNLRADGIADFNATNRQLEDGGFTSERTISITQGDLKLDADQTITSHQVELEAASGNVVIAGNIYASGDAGNPDGGRITLSAGQDARVLQGATLVADAWTGTSRFPPQSGQIDIEARTGDVEVAAGSKISVMGGLAGGGVVTVTAPRTASDIRVVSLAPDIAAREVILRGSATYSATSVDSTLISSLKSDATSWMTAAAPVLAARLGVGFVLAPAMRVMSTGNLTVADPIDLHGWAGEGLLELNAARDLLVASSVSDGFSDAGLNGTLLSTRSSTLVLQAGRDVVIGDSTIRKPAIVRTGTGDITISSGRNLLLGGNPSGFDIGTEIADSADPRTRNWAIYTAGRSIADETGFVRGSRLGDYPVDGGNLTIRAAGSIASPLSKGIVTPWLFRYGHANVTSTVTDATVDQQSSWSIYFPGAQTLLGALGGGDVEVRADGSTYDLTLAVPTTGQQTAPINMSVASGAVVVRGGGNLQVMGGNVVGGTFLVGRGLATLSTAGFLTADRALTISEYPNYYAIDLYPMFLVSDGAVRVRARRDAHILGVLDPMMLTPSAINLGSGAATYFSSYAPSSEVDVLSISGDVMLDGVTKLGKSIQDIRPANRADCIAVFDARTCDARLLDELRAMPANLRLTAYDGDIVTSALTLAPSPSSAVELAAGRDIDSEWITLLEFAPEFWRTAAAPFTSAGFLADDIAGSTADNNYWRGAVAGQPADFDPVRVYALRDLHINAAIPKSVSLMAGRDLSAEGWIEHHSAADLSSAIAGRDLLFKNSLLIYGPGRFTAVADRSFVGGLSSVGRGTGFVDRPNSALPERGADLTIVTGIGEGTTDYSSFVSTYLDPSNAAGVVRTYLPELRQYLATEIPDRDFTVMSDAQLLDVFDALPSIRQAPFIQRVFMAELRETGIDYNDASSPRFGGYARGRKAIALLYPEKTTNVGGNIQLLNQNVQTTAGGDIDLLAPYGSILLDDPSRPRQPYDAIGGVVTRRGGNIRAFAANDIALVTSRAFTLQGGDITMWASHGDIKAGDGAKAVAIYPPPYFALDRNGTLSLDLFGLQTGSGIGVLDALDTGGKKGRVDLIAPEGTVDAGEAGIRVHGDLNIAALRVIGADNIQVTGVATGIPKIQPVNAAALSSASDASSSVASTALEAMSKARPTILDLPSIIVVEVLGFGDWALNQ